MGPGLLILVYREDLREQHALSEEIGRAITDVPLSEQPDEEELDAELEGLEQEQMDERMLNTGPTPVTPALDRLPAAGTSDRKSLFAPHSAADAEALTWCQSKQEQTGCCRGGRRGGGASQIESRNGHVTARVERISDFLVFFMAKLGFFPSLAFLH